MINNLIFDLDNTLYSARYGLEKRVSSRIVDFLASRLRISREEAGEIHRNLTKRYGTTLEYLMVEQGFTDVEFYYQRIHPADEADDLPPDPELGAYLASLPMPKAVLTNSPREHAERILSRLGIGSCFTHIFDIRFNGFRGKPGKDAFLRALDAMNAAPGSTLFVDDCPEYIDGYLALGGKALLLDEFDACPDYPYRRIRTLRELDNYLGD
jgi:putative hydrolase of the HAD superfamily